MTTTPKKAPTAFDDVLTLVDALRILAERRPVKRADLDSLHDSICVLADHYAAERAEAEAAQEPGDSVEGLMRECDALAEDDTDPLVLEFWGDRYWVAGAGRFRTGAAVTPTLALRILRDALKPAAPDATWLDTATFEEMEAWLPDDWELRRDPPLGHARVWSPSEGYGPYHPNPTEAVRAYLQASPELWKDRR